MYDYMYIYIHISPSLSLSVSLSAMKFDVIAMCDTQGTRTRCM